MEYLHPSLPPIRTLMMLFSRKKGMSRYMRLYYLGPMSGLAAISITAIVWYIFDNVNELDSIGIFIPILIGTISLSIPVFVYWRGKTKEKYEEIAKGFKDQDFVDYLAEEKYEKVLRNH
jgi:hypothetical protein